jgi:hypothetical protein
MGRNLQEMRTPCRRASTVPRVMGPAGAGSGKRMMLGMKVGMVQSRAGEWRRGRRRVRNPSTGQSGESWMRMGQMVLLREQESSSRRRRKQQGIVAGQAMMMMMMMNIFWRQGSRKRSSRGVTHSVKMTTMGDSSDVLSLMTCCCHFTLSTDG